MYGFKTLQHSFNSFKHSFKISFITERLFCKNILNVNTLNTTLFTVKIVKSQYFWITDRQSNSSWIYKTYIHEKKTAENFNFDSTNLQL